MDDALKSRWNRMFAQAEEFEAVDKLEEARARSRQALAEITEAQEGAEGEDAAAIERFRHRAERFVHRYEAAYEEWNRRVQQRNEQYMKREGEDYESPLPLPADHPKL